MALMLCSWEKEAEPLREEIAWDFLGASVCLLDSATLSRRVPVVLAARGIVDKRVL